MGTGVGASSGPRDDPGRLEGSSGELVPRRRTIRPAAFVLAAVLVAASFGIFSAYRYVWGFWLYRGFPPPQVPRQVLVSQGARQAPARPLPPARWQVRALTQRPAVPTPPDHLVRVLPGTLETIEVASPVPGLRLPTIVYLPPGYFAHPQQRYPTLYLLHGVPGGPSQFVDVGDIQVAEALLVARHQMQPMVIVMPEGGTNLLDDTEWVNGVDPHQAWMSYIARDVVNAVDDRFRVVTARWGRAIGGLSEGGYGALNIALHHPGEFEVVESWSGYIQADTDPRYFGGSSELAAANTPSVEVRRERSRLLRQHTYFWFYCGRSDTDLLQNQQFAAELSALGLPHRYFAPPGDHDWGVWRPLVAQALEVASAHLSTAPA